MGGAFARGYLGVVAGETIASDVGGNVVKTSRCPRRCALVAIFAGVGRLYVGRSLARCNLVIVAGEAASRYARVVEVHRGPQRCALVAIIADVGSLQMGLALASGWRARAVMAIEALTLALGVIKADDWRPDSRCVAGRAIIRCEEVVC